MTDRYRYTFNFFYIGRSVLLDNVTEGPGATYTKELFVKGFILE